jgi:hypothetical protein
MSATNPQPTRHLTHSTSTTLVLVLLVTWAASFITTLPAHASQIPTGTIFVSDPVSCPTNFYTGMTCFGATIDCTNVDSHIDNINVTFG